MMQKSFSVDEASDFKNNERIIVLYCTNFLMYTVLELLMIAVVERKQKYGAGEESKGINEI